MGPTREFETKIVQKLLNNSESWLGLNNIYKDKLQEFQNKFIRKVFQLSPSGTPKGMLELDGQMLSIKWRIVEETDGAREDDGKKTTYVDKH